MNVSKMLNILRAQPSKSGKTLSVQAQDGWYQCKDFTLGDFVGQTINANTCTQNFPDGGSIQWINDYTSPDAVSPGHAQSPVQPSAHVTVNNPQPAVAAPQATTSAQPSSVDRDASIVAQALCKAVQFATAEQAWAAYKSIYGGYLAWADAGCPNSVQSEKPANQAPEYDDDFPF